MNKFTLAGIVGAVVCALAIWEAGRIGYARTYATRALKTNAAAAASRAVQILPNDAEVHAARGVVLQRTEEYAEACRELERASQLRPRDYFLWMVLGVTRDLNGDLSGGVASLRQSVTLAPWYANPRWLLGNLLLRQGQTDEAMRELRFAAERNRALLPNVIDLAWSISGNDAAKTVALIQPNTDDARLKLATFFASHQQPEAALEQFRKAKSVSVLDADQLTRRLIESRFFTAAYEVWNKSHCSSCRPGSFVNGSFEEEIDVTNQSFGWQVVGNSADLVLSVETAEHAEGARSLRIDFRGNGNVQAALLSQLLIVEPGKRYSVSVRVKTKSFVSAAGPVVRIVDASDERVPIIGQSTLKLEAPDWQTHVIDFTVGTNPRGVRVVVSRDTCLNNPCPAFGTLWLDSFVLNEVNPSQK